MKNLLNNWMRLAVLATTGIVAVSTAAFAQGGPGPRGPVNPIALEPATAEEIQWLNFMREEEKLARDVYRFLAAKWNFSVFTRIADSEQQHYTVLGTQLKKYNLADPVVSDEAGVFADQRLAAMYAELTAKGSLSLKDAIEVGIMIEKQDIADLETALATKKLDLKRVYNNLMTASFNHLDSFEYSLEILDSLN